MPLHVAHEGEWVQVPLPFWRPEDGSVYHYTDAYGLIGILEKSRLWASALLGLNDPTELTYGVERVLEEMADWRPGPVKESVLQFLGPGVVQLVKDVTFVVCGSTDGNALSQWRSYAGARGYAIQIDPYSTLKVLGPDGALPTVPVETAWYKVAYEEDDQRNVIQAVLQFFQEGIAPTSPLQMATTFGALISLLKPPAFRDEREIRLIASGFGGGTEKFRPGRFGVLPYIEVVTYRPPSTDPEPDSDPSPPGSLPLKSIICGPGEEYDQLAAANAASRLARSTDYPIPVSSSPTGFRFS
jgi:hypothetical protein